MAASDNTNIDERFVAEWFDFGWHELVAFLTKHANFDQWCREHPTQEESSEAGSQ